MAYRNTKRTTRRATRASNTRSRSAYKARGRANTRRSASSRTRRSRSAPQILKLVIEQAAPNMQNMLDPFNAKVEKSVGKAKF